MSTEEYYSNPQMLRRMREGPIGSYMDLFVAAFIRKDIGGRVRSEIYTSPATLAIGWRANAWDSVSWTSGCRKV